MENFGKFLFIVIILESFSEIFGNFQDFQHVFCSKFDEIYQNRTDFCWFWRKSFSFHEKFSKSNRSFLNSWRKTKSFSSENIFSKLNQFFKILHEKRKSFSSSENQRLSLEDPFDTCSDSYVYIYMSKEITVTDRENIGDDEIPERVFCGFFKFTEAQTSRPLVSLGARMLVLFHSGDLKGGQGFQAEISFINGEKFLIFLLNFLKF